MLSKQNWKYSIQYINARYVPRQYASVHSHRPQTWCRFYKTYDPADEWLSCGYLTLDQDRLPNISTIQISLSSLSIVSPGKRQNGS